MLFLSDFILNMHKQGVLRRYDAISVILRTTESQNVKCFVNALDYNALGQAYDQRWAEREF